MGKLDGAIVRSACFLVPTALENGGQVKEVQKAARHRDPGTTK